LPATLRLAIRNIGRRALRLRTDFMSSVASRRTCTSSEPSRAPCVQLIRMQSMLASDCAVAMPSSQDVDSMTSMPRPLSSLASARTLRVATVAWPLPLSALSTMSTWRVRFGVPTSCMMSSWNHGCAEPARELCSAM
jgi:hypothetical protein